MISIIIHVAHYFLLLLLLFLLLLRATVLSSQRRRRGRGVGDKQVPSRHGECDEHDDVRVNLLFISFDFLTEYFTNLMLHLLMIIFIPRPPQILIYRWLQQQAHPGTAQANLMNLVNPHYSTGMGPPPWSMVDPNVFSQVRNRSFPFSLFFFHHESFFSQNVFMSEYSTYNMM